MLRPAVWIVRARHFAATEGLTKALEAVDGVEVLILVDNATDNLSTVPSVVQTEFAALEPPAADLAYTVERRKRVHRNRGAITPRIDPEMIG
ncbi:hypothetical protein [Rhizobium sp. YTU87027]|uniref:hypothetical protein n=1 Tax=Rhizobium sp. YTU87027 TaxID=3417741 RepID=UPI003D6905BE